MLDLNPFFNSGQAADFYTRIGYRFSAADAAGIIARSDRPLAQKHTAYERLMAECPNETLENQTFPDLFAYLRACIEVERAVLGFYSKPTAGSVYAYEFIKPLWMPGKNSQPLSDLYFASIFSSPEKAIEAANRHYNAGGNGRELGRDGLRLCVAKLTADRNDAGVMVYTDMDGNVLNINEAVTALPETESLYNRYLLARLSECTDLPVPFKKGDIVSSPGALPDVYVVDERRGAWFVWGCDPTSASGLSSMTPTAPLWAYRPYNGPFTYKRRLLWHLAQYLKGAVTLDEFLRHKADVLDPASYRGRPDESDVSISATQEGK